MKKFKTWKTIKLGSGSMTVEDFRQDAENLGCQSMECEVRDWDSQIKQDVLAFRVSKKKMNVKLVFVTVAELGFKEPATIKDIYSRARKFGLGLCQQEIGPRLRLAYKEQPKGSELHIAMEPIDRDGLGDKGIYLLVNFRGIWGHGDCSYPLLDLIQSITNVVEYYDTDSLWVFRQCK